MRTSGQPHSVAPLSMTRRSSLWTTRVCVFCCPQALQSIYLAQPFKQQRLPISAPLRCFHYGMERRGQVEHRTFCQVAAATVLSRYRVAFVLCSSARPLATSPTNGCLPDAWTRTSAPMIVPISTSAPITVCRPLTPTRSTACLMRKAINPSMRVN